MIETIEYNNKIYPKFQTKGFAAQFIHPFAKKVCTGMGFDIGCNSLLAKIKPIKTAIKIKPIENKTKIIEYVI